jgi:hypothetical protein
MITFWKWQILCVEVSVGYVTKYLRPGPTYFCRYINISYASRTHILVYVLDISYPFLSFRLSEL